MTKREAERLERMKARLVDEAARVEEYDMKLKAARKRRDDLIVRLLDKGVSERAVGRLAGTSGPRANQIYHGRANGRTTNAA